MHRRSARSPDYAVRVGLFRESGRRFYLINAVRSAATAIRRSGAIVKFNERGSPERRDVRARNCYYRDTACYYEYRVVRSSRL